jgi:hypothetical protein
MVRIPLAEGGAKLVDCSRGWGRLNGDHLEIVIPRWMVKKLWLEEGDFVVVGKEGTGITIHPRDWPPPVRGLLPKAYRAVIRFLHKLWRN